MSPDFVYGQSPHLPIQEETHRIGALIDFSVESPVLMIVAFGNPVYDFIQTPVVSTGERVLSGCSTNGCLALARLGHAAALVGRLGEDYRERFLTDVRRYGIT